MSHRGPDTHKKTLKQTTVETRDSQCQNLDRRYVSVTRGAPGG